MAKELVQRILQQYGMAAVHIAPVQKGYRNESYAVRTTDGRTLNLIIYKREPGILDKIKNANYVSDFLAGQGMPARRTADSRILRLTTDKYAVLYEYLPGMTIPWEAYTMKHIKELGRAMSDMHALLRPLPRTNLPAVVDECPRLLSRMQAYFAESGVRAAMADKLNLTVAAAAHLRPAIAAAGNEPMQALHMDFVRSNILFDGTATITGILDFEKTAWGTPAFDVARTLAFLIVDCKYKEEGKVRKYFIRSGYNKRGLGSFTPDETLEDLIDFFLLHDFYKFLRYNPYESLPENEHFVRTRDFLLKRNILAQTQMVQ